VNVRILLVVQEVCVKRKEEISQEVDLMYDQLKGIMPGLCRMAVALYEKESDVLHAFLRSPPTSTALTHYSELLSNVPSLLEIAQSEQPRVVHQRSKSASQSFHQQALTAEGIQSSYTVPLYLGDELLGFVFFDADREFFFTDEIIAQLTIYTRLIEALVVMDVLPVRTLMGMVSTAQRLTGFKDEETGKHIGRVAAYVELIATGLADEHALSDEYIEYLWLYAPLHDIGKISVADEILLKAGTLNEKEFNDMKLHVVHGVAMIEQIIEDFNFGALHHIDILKNMIAYHHERWDGKGYPNGVKGKDIPLEGRIMAIADVFDALCSKRVYRDAFEIEKTFQYIVDRSGSCFDPVCVEALVKQKDKAIAIHKQFKERGL